MFSTLMTTALIEGMEGRYDSLADYINSSDWSKDVEDMNEIFLPLIELLSGS
jgi:hypothetical protein